MFGNFLKSFSYIDRLKGLQKELKPAFKTGKSECAKCSHCCWQRPGALSLEDVDKIAKHLKINREKLFEEYLVVDRIDGYCEYDEYILLPRRKSQEDLAGKFVPSDRTYDIDEPCIFLNKETKLCNIYKVRPTDCVTTECWNEKDVPKSVSIDKENLEELGWDGDEDWGEELIIIKSD